MAAGRPLAAWIRRVQRDHPVAHREPLDVGGNLAHGPALAYPTMCGTAGGGTLARARRSPPSMLIASASTTTHPSGHPGWAPPRTEAPGPTVLVDHRRLHPSPRSPVPELLSQRLLEDFPWRFSEARSGSDCRGTLNAARRCRRPPQLIDIELRAGSRRDHPEDLLAAYLVEDADHRALEHARRVGSGRLLDLQRGCDLLAGPR